MFLCLVTLNYTRLYLGIFAKELNRNLWNNRATLTGYSVVTG